MCQNQRHTKTCRLLSSTIPCLDLHGGDAAKIVPADPRALSCELHLYWEVWPFLIMDVLHSFQYHIKVYFSFITELLGTSFNSASKARASLTIPGPSLGPGWLRGSGEPAHPLQPEDFPFGDCGVDKLAAGR